VSTIISGFGKLSANAARVGAMEVEQSKSWIPMVRRRICNIFRESQLQEESIVTDFLTTDGTGEII